MTPIATKGLNKNLEAFLMLITKTEGTDRYNKPYNTTFGYGTFTDYSKHPQIRKTFLNPKTGKSDFSTAAGRYQINYPTYKTLGMTSFTPEAQDAGAIKLIKQNGAYGDVIAGKFEAAIRKTNKVWASFPESPYGQPTYTMKKAIEFIKQYAVPVVSIGIIFVSAILIYLLTQK